MVTHVSPEEVVRRGILVRIPPALRAYTQGQDEVVVEARDVRGLLDALEAAFPGIRDRVMDEAGRRRQYVNIFHNDELTRDPLPDIRLAPGDVVHILPSVAGG